MSESSYQADLAYRRADAHWRSCRVCGPAGGEAADEDQLCETGQMLTRQWAEAERRAALEEASR